MRTLIAIPALNESESLGRVLDQLQKYHSLVDVVVIDDGSSDNTAEIAREMGVSVIQHPINLGVGAALGSAFKYAKRKGYSSVIQLDADGQHRPEFLESLLSQSSKSDIVIGSRFADGGSFQTTRIRRSVMRIIAWSVSKYTKSKLTDVTSGFRFSGPRAVELFSQHYPIEYLGDTVESLILAAKKGLVIIETPVLMNERAGGLPSQSVYKASMYTGRIFLILLLAMFRNIPSSMRAQKKGVIK